MNCTLTRATSAELDTCGVHANLPPATFSEYTSKPFSEPINYATAPMAAILPSYQLPGEEELHTSFEEAISERVSDVHKRLSRQSQAVRNTRNMHNVDFILRSHKAHSNVVMENRRNIQYVQLPSSGWQRYIALIGLALIFTLIGFDLMGLLILHMH